MTSIYPVTGIKGGFYEKKIDTNASVSVVTSKQIAQKHFNDVSEALRAVPGVVLGNYSASGQNYSSNKVFINGSSNVVILVDGMRRNTNGVSGSAVNLGTLTDMASIERIEVLKGSASTLYGSDAQGGVINIITKARREIYSGSLTPANIFRALIKTAGAGKSSAT